MKLGRNDPCHCGSGRKYKKCHQREDDQRAREVKSLNTLAEWIAHYGGALETAGLERARAEEAIQAAARGWFDGEAPADPLSDAVFRQHALFDMAIAEGQTLVATAEIDATGTEPELVQKLVEALARSWLSVHEVTEVKRGKGLRLVDRLTGRNRWVGDPALAEILEPMEVVLGRVVLYDKKPMLLEGWEKVFFRGRKKAIADLDALLTEDGFEADDADGRILWLRREAGRVARRVREARPAAEAAE